MAQSDPFEYLLRQQRAIHMGLWDSVKKAAVAAKCMAGIHAGTFSKVTDGPACRYEKTCPGCLKYLTKIEHQFAAWDYPDPARCDAERVCIHCQEKEAQLRHSWRHQKEFCRVTKECERCMASEFVKHEHGRWSAGVAHPNGMQSFQCMDCNAVEERPFDPNAR